jgi:hypothetical protein
VVFVSTCLVAVSVLTVYLYLIQLMHFCFNLFLIRGVKMDGSDGFELDC